MKPSSVQAHNSLELVPVLTKGSVWRYLLLHTFQIMWGLLAMFMFNIVDTYFISRLGTNELAAYGYAIPVVMMLMILPYGVGNGLSSVASRAVGENNMERVKQVTLASLLLAVLMGVMTYLILMPNLSRIFHLMGASERVIPLAVGYMHIWLLGLPVLNITILCLNSIRALGEMKPASIIMVSNSVLAMVLDPFLIFGIGFFPRFELNGAALAAVIARTLGAVMTIYLLHARQQVFKRAHFTVSVMVDSWRRILQVGFPSGMALMVVPFLIAFLIRLVSQYGDEAVAAFGVASRVEFLVFSIFLSLAYSLGPIIGQNWGARNNQRVIKAFRTAGILAVCWGLCVAVTLFFTSPYFLPLFSHDPTVIGVATLYLSIVPLSYSFDGVSFMGNASLLAIGKPWQASSVLLVRMGVFLLPCALIGEHWFGLIGVMGGIAIANVSSGSLAFLWTNRVLGRHAASG